MNIFRLFIIGGCLCCSLVDAKAGEVKGELLNNFTVNAGATKHTVVCPNPSIKVTKNVTILIKDNNVAATIVDADRVRLTAPSFGWEFTVPITFEANGYSPHANSSYPEHGTKITSPIVGIRVYNIYEDDVDESGFVSSLPNQLIGIKYRFELVGVFPNGGEPCNHTVPTPPPDRG